MKKIIYVIIYVAVLGNTARAQEAGSHDTLAATLTKLSSDLEALKRIKFSGYVQSQFQWADSSGISSVAGGNFDAHIDKRFKVRRAEFKTMYDNGITQIVANIDVTQNGINIKDAYGKFTEQRLKEFSLTAGIFSRPFGFEVPFSSGSLESPERSRIIQTLFPGERDLGAMIGFQPRASSPFNPLKIEAGMFNGTGNNVNDFDFQKDFIGNIHWNKPLKSEKLSYALGVSYYDGGWSNGTKYVYKDISTLSNGNVGFNVDSTSSNLYAISKRNYVGGDFQVIVDWAGGLTTIRGEFIQGQQPGVLKSSVSPGIQLGADGKSAISSSNPAADTYLRKFNGAYFYFTQNIAKSKHQLVVKYDWYDPNTDVNGDEIGKAGTKLSNTDLKYTTLAFGWLVRWNSNVKIVAWYDMVKNETSANLSGYGSDLKDNVFTLRVQYKF
jgi:hypothetical protein